MMRAAENLRYVFLPKKILLLSRYLWDCNCEVCNMRKQIHSQPHHPSLAGGGERDKKWFPELLWTLSSS